MLLFRARREPRPRPRISRVVKEMAGIMAATMVPAHGFIISKRGMYSTNGAMSAVGGPFGSWMRTFLGACAWAFMIAAGSLVYAHFVKKWQSSGFPMLPITALVPGAGTSPLQQQSNQTERSNSAGGLPSGSPQFQRARPPGQTSFLEEYEG